MIASVHIADVGARTALPMLFKPPRAGTIDGLRQANVALTAPLGGSAIPSPQLGRIGLIGFWDDDAAVERFLDGHPLAEKLAAGWQVRLEPLRAHGSWPGLPDDLPKGRTVDYDGPAVVLTVGRLRLSQAVRFFRASRGAELSAVDAPGLTWATGLARPPFVATCSIWESAQALSTYAYGRRDPAHPDAIAADAGKPFHHQSAFVRFRPYHSQGRLDGKNPLTESWLQPTP